MKILVADDCVDAADSMQTLLTLSGHEVKCAYDGKQALDMFREYLPEVILLDIRMPEVNGYEVAKRLQKEFKPHHHFCIVGITGMGQKYEIEAAKQAGFDYVLIKPSKIEEVEAFIEECHNNYHGSKKEKCPA